MNSPQHTPEQKRTYSEAELRKLWKKPNILRGTYRNLCDNDPKDLKAKKIVEELVGLMYHPDAIELELLLETGELSEDEGISYIHELQVYRDIIMDYRSVAKKFVHETKLKRIINDWAKDIFQNQGIDPHIGNPPVAKFFERLQNIVEVDFIPKVRTLFLQTHVSTILPSIVREMAQHLLQCLFEMQPQKSERFLMQAHRGVALAFARFNSLKPINFLASQQNFIAMCDPYFESFASEFLNTDLEQLKKDTDELEGLLQLTSFDPFTMKKNGYQIMIAPEPLSSVGICRVMIIAEAADLIVYLDRFSQKLICFTGIGHELNNMIGDNHAYAFQREIVTTLIDHLLEREFKKPNVRYLVNTENNPVSPIAQEQEKVRTEVSDALVSEISTPERSPAVAEPIIENEVENNPHIPEDLEIISDRKKERISMINQIRSRLKAHEILSALTSILGKPLRIKGSHHIFQRRPGENGESMGSYPVALHFGSEKTFGSLMKTLKHLNITPEEYLEASR